MSDPAKPHWPARGQARVLDGDIPRVEGPLKVSGRAKYTADIRLPGMVYGRVLLCPYPSAKITLDLEPARKMRGVALAIPIERGLRAGRTVYLGQPIAAVAAATPEIAEDALRAIAVRYEDHDSRRWVIDFDQASAPVAARVSSRRENLCFRTERGDAKAAAEALGRCDAIVEATYTLPVQQHVCLETHGVVVDYRGGEGARIWFSGQSTFAPLRDAPEILGLPASKIESIVEHMGGGFGSKFPLDIAGVVACTLAKALERPVHLMLTREQEFHCAGNRSGSRQEMKGGASSDGRFVTLISNIYRLGGVGRGSHPGQPYVYAPEVHHSVLQSVLTNTDASRPMRAPGHPQASFAIESMVDELAYAVGFDPLEFRKKNLAEPIYHRYLDRVAAEIGWAEHPHRKRPGSPFEEHPVGIGFGVSTWGVPAQPICKVRLRIERDGGVIAFSGSQDLGTGTRTYVAAIPAEEFGLEVSQVEARIGHSTYPPANASGGSRTAISLAPAVKDAAFKARAALFEHLAPLMETSPEKLQAAGGRIFERGNPAKALTWKQACATLAEGGIETMGEFREELQATGLHCAQAAKVRVDTLTGAVQVLKMVSINDVGMALNRLALRNQIHGAMIQALSYALLEERVIEPELGLLLSADLDNYKIAGCKEIPEMVVILDEEGERRVKGIGEPPVIPGHGAIACAVFNACGVRIRNMPLSPAKILTELERLRAAGARREKR